uniref:Wax synthase domain-containing protein n=1 Tax=Leersia perrieri TaxID=77586 RepID=A0A0D9XRQ0_9ORYZ
MLRGTAAFFLAWLSAFKVLLLALALGPLHPGLPLLPFLLTALLPVKLRPSAAAAAGDASEPKSSFPLLVKVAAIATILRLYESSSIQMLPRHARLAVYGIHIYLFLDLLLPSISAAVGAALGGGMELEPPFDRPYMAASLREFWGRRWNLMVPAILRPSVYGPVRAVAGREAAVLAAFLVSGLMHEAMVYYMLLRPPTGEMAAFFLLHGGLCLAEEWCACRWRWWWRPPRPVATGYGGEELLLEEWVAVAAFFHDAGRKLLRYSVSWID